MTLAVTILRRLAPGIEISSHPKFAFYRAAFSSNIASSRPVFSRRPIRTEKLSVEHPLVRPPYLYYVTLIMSFGLSSGLPAAHLSIYTPVENVQPSMYM